LHVLALEGLHDEVLGAGVQASSPSKQQIVETGTEDLRHHRARRRG
jgi:hypothetical protein